MADTPSGAQGKQPQPRGRFGEGAPDHPSAASTEASHKGDSEQQVARSAGPPPRVGGGGEDTADRPPIIDRSQDSY